MSDHIATFSLRGTSRDELGPALGRCFADYWTWHNQATFVANFADYARSGGVKVILTDRIRQALDWGEAEGFIIKAPAKTRSNYEIAHNLADHQLAIADQGVKISAIVMLHNSCERLFWRLVRFGLVANREQALRWVGSRTISVDTLMSQGVDAVVDAHIEKWWEALERESLLDKWDRLVGLAGFPARLSSPPWHFDRSMLGAFDYVRHNAVHHDALAVKAFDLAEFAKQLERAQLIWLVHMASLLQVKIPAETMFTGEVAS